MDSRRKFFTAVGLGSVVGLTGCATLLSGNSAVSGTTITLQKAQAEAQVINTAVNQAAQIYLTSGLAKPQVAADINLALKALNDSVLAFTGVSASNTAVQNAQNVMTALTNILVVMPIDPVTKTYIILGETIINAFVAGIVTVPVAPVAVNAKLAGSTYMIGEGTLAPIAIPAPRKSY
jgi:hypothetical protein